jgi:hypothetical protein
VTARAAAAALALAAAALPFAAAAHEVKSVGTLDVLFHRDPVEKPVARQPAQLYFAVTDTSDAFLLDDCDCRVSVAMAGETLLDRAFGPDDQALDWGANVARADFTFPSMGLYVATFQGTSKSGAFTPFSLAYDVRVETELPAKEVTPRDPEPIRRRGPSGYVIGGLALALGIITARTIISRRKP